MTVKTPKKRGRKPIVIDYDRVEYLASLNLGIMDICRSLGVGWDIFNKQDIPEEDLTIKIYMFYPLLPLRV